MRTLKASKLEDRAPLVYAQVLDATMSGIAQHMSHLHKLIDNVALLDMLLSLATVVNRSSQPYVAPQCTARGEALLTPALLLYSTMVLEAAVPLCCSAQRSRGIDCWVST